MPTYVYRREDGSTFEIEQRITEDALVVCPETGQKVERVITGGTGLIFKGSGFYLTDYARKNGSGGSDGSAKASGSETSSGEKSNGKEKAASSSSSSSESTAA